MDVVQHSTSETFYFPERGLSKTDYRVLDKDMSVVMTTQDKDKAERLAEKIKGFVHASR